MFKILLGIGLWLCISLNQAAAIGVREGMSREEVEAELGRPLAVLARDDRVIMRYPGDGRVELVADKVVRVVRVRHVDDPPTPEEEAETEARRLKAVADAEAAAEAEQMAKFAKENAEAEVAWAKAEAEARRKLEQSVEEMTAAHEAGPTAEDFGLSAPEPGHYWIMLVVSFLVQAGVAMVGLKLAFRWCDVHADWDQMVAPAVVASLAGAAVRAAGYAMWQVTEFFYVDNAISYFALLGTLLKTTHACTMARACAVAAAAKLMMMIVWVFLSVALTQWMFG